MARELACICVPELRLGHGTIRLFVEGDVLYDAMTAAIERAENDICLESFIFAADEVGRRFAAALAAKARMGLTVKVHLDSFGSGFRGFRSLQAELEDAGVQLRWFRPFRFYRPLDYFQRNHRKLLVVDSQETYLGGFNIRRLNSRALHGEMRQRDTHVRVAGELASLAKGLFERLWEQREQSPPEAIPEDETRFDALLVPSHSRRCQHRLACLHAGLIARAHRDAYVTSPYFSPGRMVESALCAAAARGVDVRLLVPQRGDPPAAGWATRAAYARLLTAGVRVFEYGPRKLHAKTSVIDSKWSVVGSANLDYLSLFLNQELVLMARDRTVSEALHVQFQRDLGEAVEVELSAWRRRGWRERGVELVGRAARRLI